MYLTLEKYHGAKSRIICPKCGTKGALVPYVDERGERISDDCGRCNRESKCGYHKKPKEYFAENPASKSSRGGKSAKRKSLPIYGFADATGTRDLSGKNFPDSFDYIAPEHLKATLGNYDRNNFVQFLLNLFPDCGDEIQSVLKHFFVGTYKDYCCFPSLDQQKRICRAKLIRFNPVTGKRLKGDYDTSSLPAKLKLKEDFQYKQIFFGEHLLPKYPDKPVAIVEAEKTAIIASLCFPEFVWLGCNSKTWLKAERLQRLDGRRIVLYPDADGYNEWQGIALDAQRQGSTVKVSALIENHATDEQKENGYDLADYLINEQNERNELNELYDAYNSKLEKVLNDESLLNGFNLFLDEQKAIVIYNGSTETEAERICTRPENLRSVIMSI